MKKLALGALVAGLMACGGGSNSSVTLVDAPMGDTGPTQCNPLQPAGMQGCNAGEKCTWIIDVVQTMTTNAIGHVGCAPNGTVAVGAACTGGPATLGADNCALGSACSAGECKQICDPALVSPLCPANYSCANYQNFFIASGTTVAGVCDPGCNPLTQDLLVGAARTACGSPDPTKPTKGCYGFDDFSCSNTGVTSNPASLSVLDLTDRVMPRGDFLNSCAPGFVPFWYESDTSMVTKCSGYCAALPIDNTAANMNNGLGSPTVPAKLPKEAAAAAGNATCSASKKGSISGGPQMCIFSWALWEDETTGELPASFVPYTDILGTCFSYTQFKYDNDGNAGTPEVPYPHCNTLPPTSPDPMNPSLGASFFYCQKRPTTFTGQKHEFAPIARDFRPALREVELVRHDLY